MDPYDFMIPNRVPAPVAVAPPRPRGPTVPGIPPYRPTSARTRGRFNDFTDFWRRTQRFTSKETDRLADMPWMHIDDDLVRGNRARNVNQMSPEETLRYSRLADAMNNRYFRRAYHPAWGAAQYGGGGGTEAQYGELYQMPIETEEMRQMDRTRGYEQAVRSAEIARQQGLKGLELEQARHRLEAQLKESSNMSDAEIKMILDLWDYQIGYYREHREHEFLIRAFHYQQWLIQFGIPEAMADVIAWDSENNPLRAQIFGELKSIAIPSLNQIAWINAVENLARMHRYDPEGFSMAYHRLIVSWGVDNIVAATEMAIDRVQEMYDRAMEALGL